MSIALTTYDVRYSHVLFCFAICILYLMKWPLKFLAHFVEWAFDFLSSFKCFFFYIYILDNSPLSNVSFENIFSQSVAYLFILQTLCNAEQVLK